MRYSLYDMKDYGLQHRGGSVCPIHMSTYDEATWNLHWAAIPQLDGFLDLKFEDFEGFKALGKAFPFVKVVQTNNVLAALPWMRILLAESNPNVTAEALRAHAGDLRTVLGPAMPGWLTTVEARLNLAQSLVDVKDAAAVCQSVVAVDFRAGRRL